MKFACRSVFPLLMLLVSSCALLENEPVTVPAYIYVPEVQFKTDTAFTTDGPYEGANTHRFVDVWLTADGNALGNIGLPALIPIQRTGPTSIRLEPGILKSGQDGERIFYPLIRSEVVTRDLKPGVVDTFLPVFRYSPSRKFAFIEDFDRIGFRFYVNPAYIDTAAYPQTVVRINDARARQPGYNSAMLDFPASVLKYQLITTSEFMLPGSGQPVYLEMDYNSNLTLDIGYYYQEPGQASSAALSVVQLFPTLFGWNKIYIALNNEVSIRRAGTKFKFYIGVLNNGAIKPEVFLDNIKLVYLD